MNNANYINFSNKNAVYFSNNNCPIDVKKESNIQTSTFKFLEYIGDGAFTKIETKDFSIEIIDVQLTKDLIVETETKTGFIEFSHLLSGEQKINSNTKHGNILYKSNQSFLAYLVDFSATYHFKTDKRFKEIRIRISDEMRNFLEIDKNKFNIHTIDNTFIVKTKKETEQLLVDLIENNKNCLSKHIYMKGKIAEILSLYLSTDHTETPFCDVLNSIKESKKIIKKNLDKQLTSKEIAKKVQLNEMVLKQNFKAATGLSIQKFSLQLKMERAKKLLKYSEMPIYEIAEEVGYKNATHFTNAFKKNTHVLPKKFRSNFSK